MRPRTAGCATSRSGLRAQPSLVVAGDARPRPDRLDKATMPHRGTPRVGAQEAAIPAAAPIRADRPPRPPNDPQARAKLALVEQLPGRSPDSRRSPRQPAERRRHPQSALTTITTLGKTAGVSLPKNNPQTTHPRLGTPREYQHQNHNTPTNTLPLRSDRSDPQTHTANGEIPRYCKIKAGADRAERAAEHRAGAQGAPDLDPVREPRPTPGSAGVAGGGGPAAQAFVSERRGGYCFEQNLLLKAALEALGAAGADVPGTHAPGLQPGRGAAPESPPPACQRETAPSWHADVGFSRGILEPIPFGPGATQEQSGWSFRVVKDGSGLVLQKLAGEEWRMCTRFLPQPVPLIDVETSNWWTSTPLLAVRHRPDRGRSWR